MLTVQGHGRVSGPRRGGRAGLTELRRNLANPFGLSDRDRQCLVELARRASRIQSRGGEYVGVGLSDQAVAAMCGASGVA